MFQDMLAMSSGGGDNKWTFSIDEYQLSRNVVGEHVDFQCTNAMVNVGGKSSGGLTLLACLDNGVITADFSNGTVDVEYSNGTLSIKRISAYAPAYCWIKIAYN